MKRKSIFKLLTTTFALAIVGGGAALLGQNDSVTASAASAFTMGDKAAVRVGDDATDSGIRFYAYMDEETRTKARENGYGFLIFPQSYLGTVTDDYHDTANIKDYVEIVGDPSLIYMNQDGGYTAHGVLAPVNHFEKDFTCVAWVAESPLPENYGDDGVEYAGEFTYATVDSAFSRSAYQVASAAYIEESDKRDGLVAAYTMLGTETNPVLITSAEQLEMISEDVADGTTTFADVNFKLNSDITLSDDFASIGSAFEGKIDGNGKTITANYSAMIVEDFSDLAAGTTVENVTEYDPIASIVTVDENTVSKIGNSAPSIEKGYATQAEWNAAGITANGYTGNARVFTVTSTGAKNNQGYTVTMPEMNARQKAQLLETYTHVKFWIAVDRGTETEGSETTTVLSKGSGNNGLGSLVALANGSQYNVTSAADNYNTWIPFTVSIDTFFEAVGANSIFVPFCTYQDSDTLRKFYVGDFELITDVPKTNTKYIEITQENWETNRLIYNNDSANYKPGGQYVTYMTAEELADAGLSGKYTGNAVRYKAYNNSGWRLKNIFTTRQLYMLPQYFDYLRINIAAAPVDSATTTWSYGMNSGLVQYAEEASSSGYITLNQDNQNTWLTLNIPINDFVNYVLDTAVDNSIKFYTRTYSSYMSGQVYYYFGDIELIADENVATVSKASSIIHGDYTETFVTSHQMKDVISGSYEGNAVRYTVKLGNTSYYKVNGITENQYRLIEENGYDYVRLNLAVEAVSVTDGWYFYLQSGILQYGVGLPTSSGTPVCQFYNSNLNTWVTVDIPIDSFIEYAEGKTEIELFKYFWGENVTSMYLYIGDVEFVKSAS